MNAKLTVLTCILILLFQLPTILTLFAFKSLEPHDKSDPAYALQIRKNNIKKDVDFAKVYTILSHIFFRDAFSNFCIKSLHF